MLNYHGDLDLLLLHLGLQGFDQLLLVHRRVCAHVVEGILGRELLQLLLHLFS